MIEKMTQEEKPGHALSGNNKWDILCLPMEYEVLREKRDEATGEVKQEGGNRCCTALGFIDPRTEEGELLHPERWGQASVEKAKNDLRLQLGDFGVSSQFQQRPTPLGGGMFKPDNLIMLSEWPPTHDLENIVRYWDKAASSGIGCFTSGALMARRKSTQRTVILHVHRGQWGTDEREQQIKDTAFQDLQRLKIGAGKYSVRIEQEPGSGGKDSALWTVRNLAGFDAKAVPKTADKISEWAPLSSQVNSGGVEMVVGAWNTETKRQMETAPFGAFRDDLDSLSGGFKHIWLTATAGVLG